MSFTNKSQGMSSLLEGLSFKNNMRKFEDNPFQKKQGTMFQPLIAKRT
jgi:hypothetical protein